VTKWKLVLAVRLALLSAVACKSLKKDRYSDAVAEIQSYKSLRNNSATLVVVALKSGN